MPLFDEFGNEVTDDQLAAYLAQAQQNPAQQGRPFVRDLESRLAAAQQETATERTAREAAEKQLAFAQAGIPLDNPLTSYFVAGYQGEMTADAIKAEAAKLNLIQPTQQPPAAPQQPQNPPAHQAQQQFFTATAEATQGQTVPGTRDFDAEITAAGQSGTMADVVRLANERAAAEGRTQPAVVND